MLINNEVSYGYSIHRVTKYLDDGEILSQKKEKITSSYEFKLSSNHKRLEHQSIYRDLIKFLN
jgi:folate-dependent phosphoribosylglycinamide formyltransferase PurN